MRLKFSFFALVLVGRIYGADIQMAGVNLSGAEFGSKLPGTYNTDYTYPNQNEADYFKRRGLNVLRLCFQWERLQATTNAAFNAAESNRLNTFVTQTTAKGMNVILDPHNFGRYYTQTIGSAAVPYSAFSNFWAGLAAIYKTNQHVIFGLMNEPHDMSTNTATSTETWRSAAQAAILAIRNTGATNLILVPGNAYTGAQSWLQNWYGTPNGMAMLSITDPAQNFAFEVHQYLDSDSSGSTTNIVSATVGADRLAGFTQWCRANHRRGFLGEFAVANSTIGSGVGDEALTNMLSYVRTNADVWMGWAWWSAGPWWGNYMFTLEPTNNFTADQPAMGVLRPFLPVPTPALQVASTASFSFPTWPGFLYQPQLATGLPSAGWVSYGAEIPGSGQAVPVTVSSGSSQRYFRVRVRLGP
jgi:endoglucanase